MYINKKPKRLKQIFCQLMPRLNHNSLKYNITGDISLHLNLTLPHVLTTSIDLFG